MKNDADSDIQTWRASSARDPEYFCLDLADSGDSSIFELHC